MDQIIDEMSIVHFFNFFILGLLLKNRLLFAFLLGIAWELFEYQFTRDETIRKLLIKYWPIPKRLWEENNILNRVFDLCCNMIGYYFGNKI
jgi:hypothetical protein